MASVEENKATIERFMADLGNNIEGVREALADDAKWIVPQLPELSPIAGEHDKASFVKMYQDHRWAFPDGKVFTIKRMTAEGDRVAVEATGTGQSVFGPFDNRYHFLFILRDGKVIEAKEYADSLYMSEFAKAAAAKGAGLPQVRRVVTGHDGSGRSVVVSDEAAPLQGPPGHNQGAAGLWATQGTPSNAGAAEPHAGVAIPGPGGTAFVVVQYPPESDLATMTPEQRAIATASPAEHIDGLHKGDTLRHFGMHFSETVDYGVMLSGEVTMLLDEGEVTLRAGDVVVQRGAAHAWANRGTVPAMMAVVIVGAQPLAGRTA